MVDEPNNDGQGADQGGDAKVAADAAAAAAAAAAKGGDGKDGAGADGAGADGAAKPQVVPFPDDWRDRMAGGDAKALQRLARYTSPDAVGKALIEAQDRLRAGKGADDAAMPDPEKDPEGAKAWRAERNVPADPTGYVIDEKIKTRLTDADIPVLAQFTEFMHGKNWPQAKVNEAIEWYVAGEEAAAQAMAENDKIGKQQMEDALRTDWGPDYRANMTVAERFAGEIFPGISLDELRLPDGRKLSNIPEVMKAFAERGLDLYGDVAFAGGAAQQTTARKAELENIMKTDIKRWEASPDLKAELFKIIEAEDKAKSRTR